MKYIVFTLISDIAEQLTPLYTIPEERTQTAWWILEAITGKKETTLLAEKNIELTKEQESKLKEWLYKHVEEKMPLQYLIGFVPFDEVKILVEPPTLIPRPETEEWTVHLIKKLQSFKEEKISILELATGSGCIAIALAKALPHATIYATDISEKALELAIKNAQHNNIKNIEFIHSDVFQTIPPEKKFDLIISNPPYITSKEWNKLDPMVKDWEDKQALVAEHEGLAIIEKIIHEAPSYVKENKKLAMAGIPQVILEVGYRQAEKVKALMKRALFNHIKVEKDLEGKDRLVTGRV